MKWSFHGLAMELTMMYVIAGGLFLLTIVLMFMLKNIMDKVSDLEDANDGVLSKLNISQKKGEAGEQLVASVTGDLIDAGILEQDVSLPDNKSMDFASVIGTSEDGGTIYLPIDSKVNKANQGSHRDPRSTSVDRMEMEFEQHRLQSLPILMMKKPSIANTERMQKGICLLCSAEHTLTLSPLHPLVQRQHRTVAICQLKDCRGAYRLQKSSRNGRKASL